jgi:hypothetical protein
MALGEAVPGESRNSNTYRFLVTCGSAVALALVAVCFLATKGNDIGSIEEDVESKIHQLHEQASQSRLRSRSFLLLQGVQCTCILLGSFLFSFFRCSAYLFLS